MVTKPRPPMSSGESAEDLKMRHLKLLTQIFAETGNQKVLDEVLRLQKDIVIDSLARIINAQADAYNSLHPTGPRMPKL